LIGVSGVFVSSPGLNAARQATTASARLANTFQPANDNPRNRPAASSHDGGVTESSAPSRSPASVVMPDVAAAPQSAGPGHQCHSTPE
jgi:hypothetical protein